MVNARREDCGSSCWTCSRLVYDHHFCWHLFHRRGQRKLKNRAKLKPVQPPYNFFIKHTHFHFDFFKPYLSKKKNSNHRDLVACGAPAQWAVPNGSSPTSRSSISMPNQSTAAKEPNKIARKTEQTHSPTCHPRGLPQESRPAGQCSCEARGAGRSE